MKYIAAALALATTLIAGHSAAQVVNGSFEGTTAPWVTQTLTGLCASRTTTPPNGAFFSNPQPAATAQGAQYAEVYVQANNSTCVLYQDVAITAATSQLTLSAASGFNGAATVAASVATAEVTTTAGVVLTTLYTRDGSQPADANFQTYTANLTPYIGQTVRIRYTIRNNAACCATVFADAVSLSAAPAPVPTLSEWAMILFGTILAGGAALYIQRRRQFV